MEAAAPVSDETTSSGFSRLIESDSFPFEFLSALAERESWRKEIYRPVYHLHKWWAKRLGSVFRGILLGCVLSKDARLQEAFYEVHDLSGVTVLDPFMGSGTTVGEAHKLGCAVLGRDINPVACESVRVALGPLDRGQLIDDFHLLESTVGRRLLDLYKSEDEHGRACDVLYYFWVKSIPCPHCTAAVDLFSSRVFARNAYPNRKPEVQVCCPRCGAIFAALNGQDRVECCRCGRRFDPQGGAATGTKAECPACARTFAVAEVVRELGSPPDHRLYAKLILMPQGAKRYLPPAPEDVDAYRRCTDALGKEVADGTLRLPSAVLADGFNTRQALGYNYRSWRDFFNDRQLLALGWLQEAIGRLPDTSSREAFLTLFSGVLEFNNLFASYKGEGTGAVRHMFSHHILKPERTPIEANVWGTPHSSGSFSSLFKTRLLRALDYRSAPFEVTIGGSGKARAADRPFSGAVSTSWPVDGRLEPRAIHLSCGSSDQLGLPSGSVDYVVTDPPFFDNVHYSELADFFYSWQSLFPRGFLNGAPTTRHPREVQDGDGGKFASKLRAVFSECRRVLKDQGLLVFTYHHSRTEGWTALVEAVFGAGFSVLNAHPVKSEMSVATPKSQSKEPIQLDVILVCTKREQDRRLPSPTSRALALAVSRAREKLSRLASVGLDLSPADRRIVVISQFIAELGPLTSAEAAVGALSGEQSQLESAVRSLSVEEHQPEASPAATSDLRRSEQMKLPLEF